MEVYKIEIPVGGIIKVNDVWLKCVEVDYDKPMCENCVANRMGICSLMDCYEEGRLGHKEVMFIKVNEKEVEV